MTRISALAGVAAIAMMAGMPALMVSSAQAQNRGQQDHMRPPSSSMQSPGHRGSGRDQAMQPGSSQGRNGVEGRSTSASSSEMRGGSVNVSIESFQEKLRPEGEFVEVRDLGQVWKPRDIKDDWKPYTNGRWIFNKQVGWYFESDEPWAEITYHYGRWYDDPDQGWVWVADTEWAPAWVEWRRSKQYVGWRPLPPRNAPRVTTTRTETRSARRSGGSVTTEEWVFVPSERITSERITTVMIDEPRVTTIYEETRPIGRVERRGGISVNFAIDPVVLERESNVRIESRNLPRAELAPVPQQVQSISTEARTTIKTNPSTGTSSTEQNGTQQNATRPADGTQPNTATAPSGQTSPDKKPADSAATQPTTGTSGTAAKTGSQDATKGQAAGDQSKSGDQTKQADQLKPADRAKTQANAPSSGDSNKTDAAKTDASKSDAAKSEAAKTDAAKSDAAKTEQKRDAAKAESSKANAESAKSDTSKPADKNEANAQKRLPNDNAAAGRSGSGEANANRQGGEPRKNVSGASSDEQNAAGSADQQRRRGEGQARSAEPSRPSGSAAGQARSGGSSDETTGTPAQRRAPAGGQGASSMGESPRGGGAAAGGKGGGADGQTGPRKLPPAGGAQSE